MADGTVRRAACEEWREVDADSPHSDVTSRAASSFGRGGRRAARPQRELLDVERSTRDRDTTTVTCNRTDFSASCLTLSRLTPPHVVPIDQLLCLPEPLTLLNGFSCTSAARPGRGAWHAVSPPAPPHCHDRGVVHSGRACNTKTNKHVARAVVLRDLLEDLHHHQVLVDLRRRRAEQRSELELVRRDLPSRR